MKPMATRNAHQDIKPMATPNARQDALVEDVVYGVTMTGILGLWAYAIYHWATYPW